MPAPVTGGELFALIREGKVVDNRYCEWWRWAGSAWEKIHDSNTTSSHTCASGDPGSPAAERMEGTLDVVEASAFGDSPVTIPAVIGFAAVPWDTGDNGNMWETHLAPPAIALDEDILPNEVAEWHRAGLWAGLLEAYLP